MKWEYHMAKPIVGANRQQVEDFERPFGRAVIERKSDACCSGHDARAYSFPMPTSEVTKRGGPQKVRRIKIGTNRYATVFVVPKKGPRGGKTVLGPIRKKKGTK